MTDSNDRPVDPFRALANRWALKARDHAREAKSSNDAKLTAYHRGIAETYHKASMELADAIQNAPVLAAAPPVPAQPEIAAPKASTEPPHAAYTALPVKEVIVMLDYAGISPRDVTMHTGNIFTAVFSRWQPYSDEERLAMLRAVDLRIVVLGTGKLRDTGDPYVEFAYKELP